MELIIINYPIPPPLLLAFSKIINFSEQSTLLSSSTKLYSEVCGEDFSSIHTPFTNLPSLVYKHRGGRFWVIT